MKSYKKKSVGLISLRAKIKGFEATAKQILKEANKNSGQAKSNLKGLKGSLGYITREHLIAYALIRKIPYSKVENKNLENNQPNAEKILKIIEEHDFYAQLDEGTNRWRKWTIDDVKKRLIRETVVVEETVAA